MDGGRAMMGGIPPESAALPPYIRKPREEEEERRRKDFWIAVRQYSLSWSYVNAQRSSNAQKLEHHKISQNGSAMGEEKSLEQSSIKRKKV